MNPKVKRLGKAPLLRSGGQGWDAGGPDLGIGVVATTPVSYTRKPEACREKTKWKNVLKQVSG